MSELPALLARGVWHTTTLERFEGIREAGAILPEPAIPDAERWHTSQGPDLYPYARHIGAISLFDFRDFDAATYNEKYPLSVWQEFVPFRDVHRAAIWLEIDEGKMGSSYLDPKRLLDRWKADGAYKHTIMPMIEGAHLGPIPQDAICGVFAVVDGAPATWSVVSDAWEEPADIRSEDRSQ